MEIMGRMYGMDGASFRDETLIVNTAHPAIKRLIETPDDEKAATLYRAARLAAGTLPPAEAADLARGIYKLM
jgi:hypothetical protein